MLFLRYLWVETIARLFIPVTIFAMVWLYLLVTLWKIPYPWFLIPTLLAVGTFIIFVIVCLITITCMKMYEVIWSEGYVKWREIQLGDPTNKQKELDKLIIIIERYRLETKLKKNSSAAALIYQEYQVLLALSDGVKPFEDIELKGTRYLSCLKSKNDLW